MNRFVRLLCIIVFFVIDGHSASAQQPAIDSSIFKRITEEMKSFVPDTSTPPNDQLTKKIKELRAIRGGFNINEAIKYQIEEDKQKGEKSPEEIAAMEKFFKEKGETWINNGTIWIYRKRFTLKEVNELIKFFKTPAGQKYAADSPLIMIQTAAVAEWVKKAASN